MINSDNFMKLRSIFNEVMLNARDAELKNADQLSVKICHLMDSLVQMQSLIISIRAELIEKMFSIHPELPREITNQIKSEADNIILFNRRKAKADRRELHTYLPNDRRIGIANRRNSA